MTYEAAKFLLDQAIFNLNKDLSEEVRDHVRRAIEGMVLAIVNTKMEEHDEVHANIKNALDQKEPKHLSFKGSKMEDSSHE